MKGFISGLPKVELHLHLEGTLEPELMLALAERNNVALPFSSVESLKAAYQFDDLQAFLKLYYQGAAVLRTEQDFYDLTYAYLERCKREHILHTEVFFDPQTHSQNGVAFETVIEGIIRALADGEACLGVSSGLIMCFLRDLPEEDAIETLKQAISYRDDIIAVGLDSSELGNPPQKFERVFAMARNTGFRTVAHAGEEGPAEYIWEAIEALNVERIDHGVRCSDDPKLVAYLAEHQLPLTVCPLSNVKLKVFEDIGSHNIIQLFRQGVLVTINSDDPAYFGGYLNDNFLAVAKAFDLTKQEVAQMSENAIRASFLSAERKQQLQQKLDHYLEIQFRPVI
ncbi:adenosine deaminase [Photobacterium gaetbulicola]|uniref:Adenine deaminase n=1 Tax=Photobacterium gaetbulicola Gung47 TaxID=658445 RepID=A0A0C5WE60_9GAMM|nr:adenosine deaminase [Photobacterium gaetbulicola]AJR05363.1 adenosine deaminase [Photobacterium gaetbulicola Gung47]PSU12687.1 adenosine deaminase [Photobacterium gaetbulicola]